jgi:predicted RNA binding protein YcfA (HicA-like mRNA interferase family)
LEHRGFPAAWIKNSSIIQYIWNMPAREIMHKLKAHGWELDRINGFYHVFIKTGRRPVSVPFHGNRGIRHLAKKILKEAGIE